MIIWSARPQRGPKAPPGKYQVRISSNDDIKIKEFMIKMDPNIRDITQADLKSQFDLAMEIRDKTTAANEAVIKIRKAREDLVKKDSARYADNILELTIIEEALYQTKNRSNQDPLNFPIRLNNRLASLRRSVETGDARPTNGAYQVFEELSAELKTHLGNLEQLLGSIDGN